VIWFLMIASAALIAIGVPIAFAMGGAAVATFAVYLGHLPYEILAQRIVNAVDKYPLLAIPLFILAGELMNTGGLTERLVTFCRALIGWVRGGLGLVTVATAVFLSGISGSGTADAAGLAKVLVPAMRKQGYDRSFAASLVAGSATLGPIIPPSIVMVVYAAMTNISVGKLFLAGVVPGLLIAAAFMAMVVFLAAKRGYPREPWQGVKALARSATAAAGPLAAPALILAGLLFGWYGATEAGVVVVIYALALGFFYRELTWAHVWRACRDTAISTAAILFVIAVSALLGWILAVGRLPQDITAFITYFGDQRTLVILAIIVALYVLGLALDGIAIMVILVPAFVPIASALQMDPIQFAMIVILCIVVGGISPPVGILYYVVCQVTGTPFREVTGAIWWFVLAITVVLLAVAFVPWLSLALPNAMIGS
jgi:tripartite ATP-independent transporter DctM subunit